VLLQANTKSLQSLQRPQPTRGLARGGKRNANRSEAACPKQAHSSGAQPEVAGPPTLGVAIRGVIAEEGCEAARRSLFDYPLRVAHPPLAVTIRRVHQLSTVRTMVPSPPPIGGRLSGYWEGWVHIGAKPWVLSTIRYGYKIPFLNPPPLTMVPIHRGQYLSNPERYLALAKDDMYQKGAIELAPTQTLGRIFLIPKPGCRWRPIIDLSGLNAFIKCPSFKMETPAAILSSVQKGYWITSLDLRDVHVPVHLNHRHYLRFCLQGKV